MLVAIWIFVHICHTCIAILDDFWYASEEHPFIWISFYIRCMDIVDFLELSFSLSVQPTCNGTQDSLGRSNNKMYPILYPPFLMNSYLRMFFLWIETNGVSLLCMSPLIRKIWVDFYASCPAESGIRLRLYYVINWNIFVLNAMIIKDSRNLPRNPILLSALQLSMEIFPHPSCSFCKFPMKMFLYENC